jgi:deazaflavin-dependent oxidoreductase (nitroreductase family)
VRAFLALPIFLYRIGLGPLLNLAHIMVLIPRGRRTGRPRPVAIEYRQHGSKLYIISIWGERPQWYRNLCANPIVTIWRGRSRYTARAYRVEDRDEAIRVLYLFRKRAPRIYDPLIARLADRESIGARDLPDVSHHFTIVRLDRL